jgi:uncharacterized RDD family membrane protein YckC
VAGDVASVARDGDDAYPGLRLGLPRTGPGSVASWRARIAALIIDWAACMALAVGLFGSGVLVGSGWRSWMILAAFFVESATLGIISGASAGQLLARIEVVRLDRRPLGVWRSVVRAALVSLALPPLIIGPDRRGLHDLLVGTVVLNRR